MEMLVNIGHKELKVKDLYIQINKKPSLLSSVKTNLPVTKCSTVLLIFKDFS